MKKWACVLALLTLIAAGFMVLIYELNYEPDPPPAVFGDRQTDEEYIVSTYTELMNAVAAARALPTGTENFQIASRDIYFAETIWTKFAEKQTGITRADVEDEMAHVRADVAKGIIPE
jgi:hypothetical protein